jgi:hypothetical protein
MAASYRALLQGSASPYMMDRVLSRLDSATRLYLIKHYSIRVLYMMVQVLSRLDSVTWLHLIKHYFKIQLVPYEGYP